MIVLVIQPEQVYAELTRPNIELQFQNCNHHKLTKLIKLTKLLNSYNSPNFFEGVINDQTSFEIGQN